MSTLAEAPGASRHAAAGAEIRLCRCPGWNLHSRSAFVVAMDIFDANSLVIARAKALRSENSRMRELAWAHVEQSRALAQQLAAIRNQSNRALPMTGNLTEIERALDCPDRW
ncbi:hypothetical protein [Mesorhizobium sp.]|uniref:hypothetical protein n=1 Tax=Mesorhizobium sp. TaxID=1871066 RepID=UPI0025B81946|nr:hypothetical protein [Mesorhizobium sp.]